MANRNQQTSTSNQQPVTSNRFLKRVCFWIKLIITIYLVIGICLYFLQGKIFLHPKTLPADYIFHFNVPFKEVNIPVSNNENLNLIQFLHSDSVVKGVVIYFHGNMENINHYAKFSENFTKNGYEVWMPDYPGFGKTTGDLTEKKLYEEALQVYQLASARFGKDRIVIYGRSFGTGIASELASVMGCRRLILETPYYSIPELFSCYAPIYPTWQMSKLKLPTADYLKDVRAPVTIFHGSDDGVIPYSCASKLKNVLKLADEFITIQNGKHNNLNDFPEFHRKLDSLLR